MEEEKSNSKKRTMRDTFDNAITGIIEALQTQKNMRFHFLAAILILVASLFLSLTKIELIVLAFAIALVLITELINTSIEIIVNMVSPQFHEDARKVKDISAGFVLLAAINAAVIGYLVFFTRLISVFPSIVIRTRHAPVYLTFIAIVLVLFFVIIAKAASKKKGRISFMHGGMPSGHAAMAFACWAVVVFLSKNMLISGLTLVLSVLVSYSRIKDKVHNTKEVLIGGLLGFLVTMAIFQIFS